jgi:glucan biosynthesis protein C
MGGDLPGWAALQGLAGWAWIVAILGFAGSLLARRAGRPAIAAARPVDAARSLRGRAARYATEAGLPFYVLHEPVIVAAGWLIVRWHAPVLGKYAALVIVSFATTLALYEVLVRRWRVTRFLAGMKTPPARRAATRAHPQSGAHPLNPIHLVEMTRRISSPR